MNNDKVTREKVETVDLETEEQRNEEVAREVEGALEVEQRTGRDDGIADVKVPIYKRRKVQLAALAALVVALVVGTRYYAYAAAHETTDDAFIDGHVVQVSPQVSGRVTRVYVTDNQEVKAGDLLFEIDSRDYEAKVAAAKAQFQAASANHKTAQLNVGLTSSTAGASIQQASSGVGTTQSGVGTAEAQVGAAQAKVAQAHAAVVAAQREVETARAQVAAVEAQAQQAKTDERRYASLYSNGVVSQQQYDVSATAARTTAAQLQAAEKRVASAEAQVAEAQASEQSANETVRQAQAGVSVAKSQVGEAQGRLAAANAGPQQIAVTESQVGSSEAAVQQAQAALDAAELELSYTKVYAPEDGRVAKKGVEPGMLVQPGQALLAVVSDDVWVTANFKETQLDAIHAGQPVEIKVDAYPGVVFKGHVDSIQTGSGARFSLLPPENATGNYVKVVQRVPVKIAIDERPQGDFVLGPGMSAEPEVVIK